MSARRCRDCGRSVSKPHRPSCTLPAPGARNFSRMEIVIEPYGVSARSLPGDTVDYHGDRTGFTRTGGES